jgi:hypothetical protein
MTWMRSIRRELGAFANRSFLASALAAAALAASAPGRALADYTCEVLEVPGATWNQIWQINNAGQVAAGSSLGAFIFTGEDWQQLPPPPAGSGYAPTDLAALGINDFGTVVGGAGHSDASPEVAFILAKGSYTFFSDSSYPCTGARAIGNNGVVTGTFGDCPTGTGLVGFVYNPTSAPDFPPGFTEIVPTLDGTPADRTIPGGMNGLGQFVGSARIPGHLPRFGFIYDPNWQSHGYAELITLFRIEERNTAARGINDWGRIVGFTVGEAGQLEGFLLTSLGHRTITCPQLPGVISVGPQSINNRGVVTGGWSDASNNFRGFIAYPDPADDLADLLVAVRDVGPGRSLESKVRQARSSLAAGNAPAACGALAGVLGEVNAQSGKSIAPALARALAAEAQAIIAEVGCP